MPGRLYLLGRSAAIDHANRVSLRGAGCDFSLKLLQAARDVFDPENCEHRIADQSAATGANATRSTTVWHGDASSAADKEVGCILA